MSGPTAVFISGIYHVRACLPWKRGAEVYAESAEVALVIAIIAGDVIMVDQYAGREGHRGFQAPDDRLLLGRMERRVADGVAQVGSHEGQHAVRHGPRRPVNGYHWRGVTASAIGQHPPRWPR